MPLMLSKVVAFAGTGERFVYESGRSFSYAQLLSDANHLCFALNNNQDMCGLSRCLLSCTWVCVWEFGANVPIAGTGAQEVPTQIGRQESTPKVIWGPPRMVNHLGWQN